MILNMAGGGAPLNFQVVGGTAQPGYPGENTIWVNTDQAITGYSMSPEQPEAPAEGMVWITIGTSSTVPFNALKKNTLMVYPLSAKQYIDGAWVDVAAKSYQNGEWVSWITYLYNHGDECKDITGGWEAYAYARADSSIDAKAAPTVTKNDGYVSLELTGQVWYDRNIRYSGGYFTKKAINMANIKTLAINVLEYSANGFVQEDKGVSFGITSELKDEFTPVASTLINAAGEYTLDVSAVSALCYVYVHIANPTSTAAKISFDEIVGK